LSEAETATLVVPLTVAPLSGVVIPTVGGMASAGAGALTLITAVLVAVPPGPVAVNATW